MSRNSNKIQFRKLTKEDIGFAMHLKFLAGWNQLPADWEFLMNHASAGNLVASYEGNECGTITAYNYHNKFTWIGMLLVDPDYRGKGIGQALLEEAMKKMAKQGTCWLDATPKGASIYERMGYTYDHNLERLVCETLPELEKPTMQVEPITSQSLNQIAIFDESVFGSLRKELLEYLLNSAPQYAWQISDNGKIKGFCMGRPGYYYDQIGPVLAEDEVTANNLLLAALSNGSSKSIVIDTFSNQFNWKTYLETLGFNRQRSLYRMYYGNLNYPGIPEKQFAITGPEFG